MSYPGANGNPDGQEFISVAPFLTQYLRRDGLAAADQERLEALLLSLDTTPLDADLRLILADFLEEKTDHEEVCASLRSWEQMEHLKSQAVLTALADDLSRDLDDVLQVMRSIYLHYHERDSDRWGDYIHLGVDTPDIDYERVWVAFCRLHAVPLLGDLEYRSFVSCSC